MENKAPPQFRLLNRDDLKAVMDIERAAHLTPWSENIFKDCMRVGYLCRVLASEERLYAYSILSFGAGEAHVLNISVDPQCQRQGYGRMMMKQLMEDAQTLDIDTILLEVRVSNKPAIALYDAFGFNEIGIRKNYYPDKKGREDALLLAKVLFK